MKYMVSHQFAKHETSGKHNQWIDLKFNCKILKHMKQVLRFKM